MSPTPAQLTRAAGQLCGRPVRGRSAWRSDGIWTWYRGHAGEARSPARNCVLCEAAETPALWRFGAFSPGFSGPQHPPRNSLNQGCSDPAQQLFPPWAESDVLGSAVAQAGLCDQQTLVDQTIEVNANRPIAVAHLREQLLDCESARLFASDLVTSRREQKIDRDQAVMRFQNFIEDLPNPGKRAKRRIVLVEIHAPGN